MHNSCFISIIAEIATIISAIVALVSMIYTIKVYNKTKKIQESVDIEKVERYAFSLASLKNFLSDLSYHSEDGLNGKDLRHLEEKAREIIEQIDRFKIYLSGAALSEQEELKTLLRDCMVRCQEWADVHTDNPEVGIDEYIKKILETTSPKIQKQIDKVIAEIRQSSTS